MKAMSRPLLELAELQEKYDAPILCAGDIFDHWKAPPELINFALDVMPEMYAVPGQHDMPLHDPDQMHRSAFYTLIKAGKIKILNSKITVHKNFSIYGSPWGCIIPPLPTEDDLNILIAHRYVWIDGKSYPGAPAENRLGCLAKDLVGYNVAVFGDNHKGFQTTCGKVEVFNCGTLMRRKTDEEDYRPMVGLLTDSMKVVPHYLSTAMDVLEVSEEIKELEETEGLGEFLDKLQGLEKSELDFVESINHVMDEFKTRPEVRKAILTAMEKKG